MKRTEITPETITKISRAGSSDDELIIRVCFECYDVYHSGYQILTRDEVVRLGKELIPGRKIDLPNMPENYTVDIGIEYLNGAFWIHSSNPEDVSKMRELFGEEVGDTGLFFEVLERPEDEEDYPIGHIDVETAEAFLEDPEGISLSRATSLDDAAATTLSRHEGQLLLNFVASLSDAAAESLSKHKGYNLNLSGLTTLSEAAAESLSKYKGDMLNLSGLTTLFEAAAESLSKYQGNLSLNGLTEFSDAVAESLSKQEGGLDLNGLTELSDAAAEALSEHL
jgi:hypothetical protein